MINIDKDYYRLLGIKRWATTNEINKAYKKKVKEVKVSDFNDNKLLREYYRQLDKALETLTDINKRSQYDAMVTYMFLKNYAWTDVLLNEKDLEKFKIFWAKLHLNRELYKSLDFNKFTPEYDLSWYVPFYLDEYFRVVEKKEDKYIPAFDDIFYKRYYFLAKTIIGLLLIIFSIFLLPFLNKTGTIILMLLGIYLGLSGIVKFYQFISFWKSEKLLDSAKVVDKWVRLSQNPLTGKLHPRYFVAYDTGYGIYYQEVNDEAFGKLPIGLSVDVVMAIKDNDKVMISPSLLKFLSKKK